MTKAEIKSWLQRAFHSSNNKYSANRIQQVLTELPWQQTLESLFNDTHTYNIENHTCFINYILLQYSKLIG